MCVRACIYIARKADKVFGIFKPVLSRTFRTKCHSAYIIVDYKLSALWFCSQLSWGQIR